MAIVCGQNSALATEHLWLKRAYQEPIVRAGGLPLLIGYLPDALCQQAVTQSDAVLLTGGEDVDPLRYGAYPQRGLGSVDPKRDATELAVVRAALAQGKPLLAICRGIQVLNVALGGTLYQDLPRERPGTLLHSQTAPRWAASHPVSIAPESLLARLIGADPYPVNSFHHQSCRSLGEGLVVTATAPDGVVEAIELPGRPVLGVQWHPEDMAADDPRAQALFDGWVAGFSR
ncbi:MAG: gamma-glutamyl-gamma-aminobutyrate hydrolase family protein [Firmicutes bacterium]|nr:gamma-glutamyl-gamma-aminobutyrate hydrolase family protein [Bacillota bacterium]